MPSKAFGEFVEQAYGTPRVTADEVKRMLDEGQDVVVVDSRPFEEYHRMNIPSSTDMPGAELALRIHDVAPDPGTFVRGQLRGPNAPRSSAPQSLINAGIENRVAALKDGTMGWHLAGFDLEHAATRVAPLAGRNRHGEGLGGGPACRRTFPACRRLNVRPWRNGARHRAGQRTCLTCARPDEYADGHLPGFRNAPGGQLVQATDEYVAVRYARLVLADDEGVRATMTASWLIQMGWKDVFVLDGGVGSGTLVTGAWQPTLRGTLADATVTTAELAARLDTVTVVDLGPSPAYEQRHIPGALWCVRARLAGALAGIPADESVVFTSPDGTLARLALDEARELGGHPGAGA